MENMVEDMRPKMLDWAGALDQQRNKPQYTQPSFMDQIRPMEISVDTQSSRQQAKRASEGAILEDASSSPERLLPGVPCAPDLAAQ